MLFLRNNISLLVCFNQLLLSNLITVTAEHHYNACFYPVCALA